jgi:hypothetical protein
MGPDKKFDAFNISHVPRSLNYDVDLLANVASKLIPSEGIMPDTFSMELLYNTSIPDNITNWRVFDDDQQIISFLHLEDNFKDSVIDEGQHDQDMNYDSPDSTSQTMGSKVTPINNIPKNVVRLEKLYDLQDKFKKVTNCKTNSSTMQFEVINLGTSNIPQNVNLGKNCSPTEKKPSSSYLRNIKTYFPGHMMTSRHMIPRSSNISSP